MAERQEEKETKRQEVKERQDNKERQEEKERQRDRKRKRDRVSLWPSSGLPPSLLSLQLTETSGTGESKRE